MSKDYIVKKANGEIIDSYDDIEIARAVCRAHENAAYVEYSEAARMRYMADKGEQPIPLDFTRFEAALGGDHDADVIRLELHAGDTNHGELVGPTEPDDAA